MEDFSVRSAVLLAAILVALSSFPLHSRKPVADSQHQPSTVRQWSPAKKTVAAGLRPVRVKLEGRLDSKNASIGTGEAQTDHGRS